PRRAFANACVMSCGALGIVVATLPTELAVQAVGWRAVFAGLGALTLAVAALVFLAVPERGGAASVEGLKAQLAGLARIYRDAAFWRLAPLLTASAGAHIGIQTLWAGPWFRDVGGLGRTGVAEHLLYMALAFGFGVLGSGAVADWFLRRGVGLLAVMLGFLLVSYAAQGAILAVTTGLAPAALGTAAWMVFSLSGQAAILAYPWLSAYFGAALSGRANTAVNLLIFGAAFATQYAIGAIIDLFPPGAAGGYDPAGYRLGFGLFLALQLLALAWYLPGARRLRR
ncbi:MAG: MFS transporter, partial [Rhodospirillales bacterium]|nr:MFS transporter [Rhodospirillales bacterium]